MADGIFVITFEGSQTIEKANMIKNSLIDALKGKNNEILINLSKIEKVDLSFLQLLYSASLEAVTKKKKISISGEVPDSFKQIINLSGFNRKISSNSDHIFTDFVKEKE